MLYVIGGEGTLRLDDRDSTLGAGSFAVVPRGTGYGFTPRGRNPLIVLAFLAGAPCAGTDEATTKNEATKSTKVQVLGVCRDTPCLPSCRLRDLRAFVVSFVAWPFGIR